MSSSTPIHQNPKWVFLTFSLSFLFFISPSLSDPRTSIAELMCESSNLTTRDDFYENFASVMEHLNKNIAQQQWGFYSIESPSAPVYGFAQCHKDLSEIDCQLCHAEARTILPRCLPAVKGRIYLEGCFIRYDNYDFFEESVNMKYDTDKCSPAKKVVIQSNLNMEFEARVEEAVRNVTEEAGARRRGGFGAAGSGAYALGQCWNTLNATGCEICMGDAWRETRKCLPGSEGRAFNAGCYLRYSSDKFFGTGKENMAPDQFKSWIIGAALVGCASVVLALFGAYIGYARFSKRREEREKLSRLPSILSTSNLNFKYEALEQATDFFKASNKLGQGGSSSVFKGTFPDGRVVAVKRLFFSTRQWVDDFFNEVNLISGIQHKNLVRLLGCSIEGPESLLVYEFLPNKSLHQILFDKKNSQILRWRQRFNVILGIAEGLAYLHRVKIIHRDIKSSNVLLDENLTPKIADFGLARCAAADKSHVSTGIAGTLGYMAPEYLLRGQLTEKADVYAFGVLALEIGCGKKNNTFTHDSGSVLQNVWKHYKAGCITQGLEYRLNPDDFPDKEVSKVLQIGLLCTQASAALRPLMSDVVQMLTVEDSVVPSPKQPPFLNASILAPIDSIGSSTMTTGTSNWHTTIDVFPSDTSPESDETSMIGTCEPR
ncbi:cysteine-rich receptor-like protein kinase 42 [Actinidia eriantha]|uniref:cysteine-rich receptor-like protein kinase 42 n=1 Tax=Actinidia eriantha TaxID=165200 RepID=UPI00258C5D4C|nr:cysteine-rich receptor-like protein kinase 42 [Actinidia eriantha]